MKKLNKDIIDFIISNSDGKNLRIETQNKNIEIILQTEETIYFLAFNKKGSNYYFRYASYFNKLSLFAENIKPYELIGKCLNYIFINLLTENVEEVEHSKYDDLYRLKNGNSFQDCFYYNRDNLWIKYLPKNDQAVNLRYYFYDDSDYITAYFRDFDRNFDQELNIKRILEVFKKIIVDNKK